MPHLYLWWSNASHEEVNVRLKLIEKYVSFEAREPGEQTNVNGNSITLKPWLSPTIIHCGAKFPSLQQVSRVFALLLQ